MGKHDTEAFGTVTQEIPYGWTRRPDPAPPPRDWQRARNTAWALAGYAWMLAGIAVAFAVLKLAVGK